jgi:sugar (pentulose or hexulose) kinase
LWRPVPGAERAEPPYELRPGTGRRGPEDLWLRFDEAVAELNRAIGGSSAERVSTAFGGVAAVAAELSVAVEQEDEITREARELARSRATAA